MENHTPFVGRIYALSCSCDPEPRYVGLTVKKPLQRLKQHLAETETDHQTRKLNWMRKHLGLGHTIEIHLLTDIATSYEELQMLEVGFIWAYRKWYRLTNETNGGDGASGYVLSAEDRKKISIARTGQKHSVATREKLSAVQAGKRHTPDTRARMSAARRGTSLSDEWRNNISVGRTGIKFSNEHRVALRSSSHNRWHVKRGIVKEGCELCAIE